MKKLIEKLFGATLILLLVAVLALPSLAATTLLSGITTTGAGTSYPTKTTGSLFAHVYSAAGSSATVVIQQSVNGTVWNTVATVTNPDATGELWHGPAAPFTRANVTSRSSGTLTAVLEYSPSTQVSQWALVNASTTSTGTIYVVYDRGDLKDIKEHLAGALPEEPPVLPKTIWDLLAAAAEGDWPSLLDAPRRVTVEYRETPDGPWKTQAIQHEEGPDRKTVTLTLWRHR